jgi:hypothetical protein
MNLKPQRCGEMKRTNVAKDGPNKSESQTSNVRQKRVLSWDPSHSWRTRKADARPFLTSLERRYLRDVLLALERSDKAFRRGFVVKPQGDRNLTDVKPPAPLAKLVVNGLITIEEVGNELRCYLTDNGIVAVENWLRTKPPNFKLMFPRLYRQLTNAAANTAAQRRTIIRR